MNGVGIVMNETCATMQHFLLFMFNVKPRTYVVERNRLYTYIQVGIGRLLSAKDLDLRLYSQS